MKNKTKNTIIKILALIAITISSILIYSFAAVEQNKSTLGPPIEAGSETKVKGDIGVNGIPAYSLNGNKYSKDSDTFTNVADMEFTEQGIKIVGKDDIIPYENNEALAAFAWVGSQEHEYTNYAIDKYGNNIISGNASTLQAVIWYYAKDFVNTVAPKTGVVAEKWSQIKDYSKIINQAKAKGLQDYIKKIGKQETKNPEFSTADGKDVKFEVKGRQIIIGALKIKSPSVNSIEVYNKNGQKLNAKIGSYEGKELKEVNTEYIKDGKEFYLVINIDENSNVLTSGEYKIIAKANAESIFANQIRAKIWKNNLRIGTSIQQDQITFEKGNAAVGEEKQLELSGKFELGDKKITIKQYGINNNGKVDTGLLGGAKFRILNKTTQKYLQLPKAYREAKMTGKNADSGEFGYNPETGVMTLDGSVAPLASKNDAYILFETKEGKELIIEGLEIGEYEIEEVEAPEGYELASNGDNNSNIHHFNIPFEANDTKERHFHSKVKQAITISRYSSKDGDVHKADTEKGKLGGAVYVIYNNNTHKYVKSAGTYNGSTGEYIIKRECFVDEKDVNKTNMLSNTDILFETQTGKSLQIVGLDLESGKYSMEEVKAPEGYELAANGEENNKKLAVADIPGNLGSHYDFIGNPLGKNEVENSIEIRKFGIDGNGNKNTGMLGGSKYIISKTDNSASVQIPRSYLLSNGKEGYDPETGTYTLDYYQPGRATFDPVIQFETREGKPIILKGLQAGDYYIEEVKTTDGYEPAIETKATFSIPLKQGDSGIREFYSVRKQVITINKYASKNENIHEADLEKGLLGGAKFTIYNENEKQYVKSTANYNKDTNEYEITEEDFISEEEIDKTNILSNKDIIFTSETGKSINLKGLETKAGKYIFEEVQAPEGYGLTGNGEGPNNRQMVTKIPDNLGSHYDFINECTVNTVENSIEIRDFEIDNNGKVSNSLLNGAKFIIYNKTTNQSVQIPRSYLNSDGKEGYDSGTGTYTLDYYQPGRADFDKVIHFETRDGKPIILKGLQAGEYEIEQIKAPDGYELSENTKATFSIPMKQGDTAVRNFYNKHSSIITINKYASKNGNIHEADLEKGLLGGAKFTVYNSDTKEYVKNSKYNKDTNEYEITKEEFVKEEDVDVSNILSNKDIIFTSEAGKSINLRGLETKAGKYILEEVEAPEGYGLTGNGEGSNNRQMITKIPDNLGNHYDFINECTVNTVENSIEIRDLEIDNNGKVSNSLLNGAKFIIYNKTTNQSVQIPRSYLNSDGKEGYDPETGIYTLDYYQPGRSTTDKVINFETRDGKPIILKGLQAGEYEIEQMKAPDGYELSENTKATFSIPMKQGDTAVRNFYNKRDAKAITINKYAAKNGDAHEADTSKGLLGGAVFTIYNSDTKKYVKSADNYNNKTGKYELEEDDFIEESKANKDDILSNKDILFTSEKGKGIILNGLEKEEGNYIIEEVKAPEGYGLSENGNENNKKQMSVKIPDNLGSHYDFINECNVNERPNSIEIRKYGKDNNGNRDTDLLGGAEFRIFEKKTNQYVQLPREYLKARTEGKDYESGEYGYNPETGVYTYSHMQPATSKDSEIVRFKTKPGLPLIIEGLPEGEYEIEEVKAPDGYELSENTKATFSIPKAAEDTAVRTFYNIHRQVITINKYEAKNGEIHEADTSKGLLGGAKYTVFNKDKKQYVKSKDNYNSETGEYEVDKDDYIKQSKINKKDILSNEDIIFTSEKDKSVVIKGLEAKEGTYIIEEVGAPEGYEISKNGDPDNENQMTVKIPDNLGSHYDFINRTLEDAKKAEEEQKKEDENKDKEDEENQTTEDEEWAKESEEVRQHSVRIRKYGIDKDGNKDNQLLAGAKFRVYSKTEGKYVKLPEAYVKAKKEGKNVDLGDYAYNPGTGAYTLDDDYLTDAKDDETTLFVSTNNRSTTLKGLKDGEYEIEEVAPPEDYEINEVTEEKNNNITTVKIPLGDDSGIREFYNKAKEIIRINNYAAKDGNENVADYDKGIIGGAKFVVRYTTKDGKEKGYVKVPDSYIDKRKKAEDYDYETGTFIIGENSYCSEEAGYDEEQQVYKEDVIFTTEEGKSIVLKNLKEANYEIEEIIAPEKYELSKNNKKTFTIADDYGTHYDFINKYSESTDYEITIQKKGYKEHEVIKPGVDYYWSCGTYAVNVPAPAEDSGKHNLGALYGVYRVNPAYGDEIGKEIGDIAEEMHTYFEQNGWGYGSPEDYGGPFVSLDEQIARAPNAKVVNCSTFVDYVLQRYCDRHPGCGDITLPNQNRWCPSLTDQGGLLDKSEVFINVPYEDRQVGDIFAWHGHLQIFAYNSGTSEIVQTETGTLLGGTKFVIRNTDTKQYVKLPARCISKMSAGTDITKEDGYDAETGRYTISASDYMSYESAVQGKTYNSSVIYESEEGKPIIIKGLLPGKYEIEEIEAPEGYELSKENIKTFTITEDSGKTIEFSNKQRGKGTFRKVIKGTETGLEGFEFQLIKHSIKEEYNEIINASIYPEVYQEPSEHEYPTCDFVDSVVTSGTYPNIVTKCKHGKDPSHAATWNSLRIQYNHAVMKANEYHKKRDEFVDKMNQDGLITDAKGYISLEPLSIYSDDGRGIIDIKEVSVGGNPYFNLLDDNGNDRILQKLNYHSEDVIKMENERKRMDIEGLIWEDLGHKKSPEWNALFDEGLENLLQPIEVSLKVDGEEIAKGVVTGDGKYRIRVGVDEAKGEFERLKRAYIEFTYNGIVYQNVDVHLDEALGSKAAENAENRTNLINNPYTTIRANNGVTSASDKGDIKYWRPPDEHTEEYKSRTRYEGSVTGDLDRDEVLSEPIGDGQYTVSKIPELEYDQKTEYKYDTGFAENCYYKTNKTTQEKYQMTATTKEAGFKEFENYTIDKDRIENVNLGLYYREQPDVSVENDIYQVRVEYDGHKYTYQYGKKSTDNSSKGNLVYEENSDVPNYQGGAFDAQVKFQDNRKYTYRREIYPSDIEIIPNSGQEINVFVTYKTEIFNESTTLTVRPTELVSQYDSKYIGYIDENGTLQNVPRDVTANFVGVEGQEAANGISVTWSKEGYGTPQQAEGYQQAYGRIDTFIPPEESRLMFTEYRLAREQCIDLINGANSIPLYNHIEMNAYTTQKEGQNYGGIDKDSHPGNMTPGNEVTYEDDNDEAPLFELVRPEKNNGNRILEGNVFEDVPELKEENGKESIPDANIGRDNIKERKANGTKEDGKDNPIQNVQVELIEVDWDESKNSWVDSGRIAKLDISIDSDRTDSDEYTKSLQTSVKSEEFGNNKDNLRNASTKTDENGNYSFHGFASGRYLLRYTWGVVEDDGTTKTRSVIKDGNTTNGTEETPIYVQQYKSTVFGNLDNGKERYKKYTEYQQDNNKPQRWYLHATNPDISSGEYKENGPDEYAHTNLSSAIDEITSTANSDPNDGSGQRTKIDDQMKKINNVNNYKDYISTSDVTPDFWGDKNDPNTFNAYRANQDMQKMYSRTVSFDIGLENLWEDNDSTTYIKDGSEDHREFKITGMDFGITERPNINLQIKKQIENVRIVLANNQILVDADIDEDGNVSGPAINTKYLKPTKKETYSDIGVLHTEMDTELMHGAVIQITYKYTIHNTSELDYVLETADYGEATIRQDNNSTLNDYYKFGIYEGEDKEVTTRATKVVDYLDNKINFDETLENDTANHPYGKDNQVWLRDEIQTKDEKGIYDKHEVFSDIETIEKEQKAIANDANTNEKVQDTVDRIKKGYLTLTRGEQIPASEESTATEEQRKRESDNGNPLKAEEETVFRLTASKDLSSTNQDTSYFNSAEIIKLDKTGGEYPGESPRSVISVSEGDERSELTKKTPSTTPANFDPTESMVSTQVHSTSIPDEPDSWTAEQVTVTPPTGDYSNYLQVGWTIIAATSLGVLSFGIMVIRNVAIKRKKIK